MRAVTCARGCKKGDITWQLWVALYLAIALSLPCQKAFGADERAAVDNLRAATDGLAYPRDLLLEVQSDLRSFEARTIETLNEDHTLRELIRIIRTTEARYVAVDHHIFGWSKEVESFYNANVDALRKGVRITRIFVLAEDVIKDPAQLKDLLSYMDVQRKDGIDVKYALQTDLNQDEAYASYSLMTAGLSDDRVLARVIAQSLRGRQPAKLIVTWDPKEVDKHNPFPYFLNSPHVRSYDDAAKEKLLRLSQP